MPASVVTREEWSRLGFLFAAIGSAVGLGNIWRFPYMVGMNGGGAFLIPYLIGVVVFALPLMLLEFYTGRKFRGSVMTAMRRIDKRLWPVGLMPLVLSTAILSYYLVVSGWTLAYFLFSFSSYPEFHSFVSGLYPLLFFAAALAITSAIVLRGIKHGIEKTSMIMMPVFMLVLGILVLNSLTLPGLSKGLSFYLTPDFSYLAKPQTWVMGISQAFFSLSVGYGILLTYGSYLGRRRNIPKYSLQIAGADTAIALLGGLMVFPIVFTFGLDPASGTELSFVSLPQVFQSMPFGLILGTLFFLLLFIAAITSAVSILEVGVSGMIDELGWSRMKSVGLLSFAVFFMGVPSALSFYDSGTSVLGMPFIDFMDVTFGSLLLLSAAALSLSITWFYRRKLFDFRRLLGLDLSGAAIFLLKYVIPPVMILVFLFDLFA